MKENLVKKLIIEIKEVSRSKGSSYFPGFLMPSCEVLENANFVSRRLSNMPMVVRRDRTVRSDIMV